MLGPSLLHSVTYAGLWGQAFLSVDQFVEKAADLGYEGVMLMAKRPHVSPLDYGPAERARLRSHLERRNLGMGCLAGYTNLTADLEHADIPNREIQIEYVVELARLARDLGGSLVRVFTGYEDHAAGYHHQWRLLVDTLRECSRRVQDFGVTLGVQNHHDLAASAESLRDLIETVDEPNCRAIFDAWAPALHGEEPSVPAERMGSLTVHTTVANYRRLRRFHYQPALVNYVSQPAALQAVPVQEGFIDYPRFLRALAAGGFRGTVAYEVCSPAQGGGSEELLDRYARLFLEFFAEVRGVVVAPPQPAPSCAS
jgi:sugar phosphate isomerase/epimerase